MTEKNQKVPLAWRYNCGHIQGIEKFVLYFIFSHIPGFRLCQTEHDIRERIGRRSQSTEKKGDNVILYSFLSPHLVSLSL